MRQLHSPSNPHLIYDSEWNSFRQGSSSEAGEKKEVYFQRRKFVSENVEISIMLSKDPDNFLLK